MKLLCLTFLYVFLSGTCYGASVNEPEIQKDSQNKTQDRIVGGRSASIESLPYLAQLLQNGIQICGASIISESWLLTAAHCILKSKPKWSIITGSDSASTGGEHHEIDQIINHPKYNTSSDENDITLIKLKKPIVFNKRQQPIPLATADPKTEDLMRISGFGKLDNNGKAADNLHTANVPIIDQEICQKKYSPLGALTDTMFCAGNGPTDACQGDSGGPGVINGELAGVVSTGKDCGSDYWPGIYTRVFKYRDWIFQNTGMNSKKLEFPEIELPTIGDFLIRPPKILDKIFNRIGRKLHL